MFAGHLAGSLSDFLSINAFFSQRDISLLCGRISVKLTTNICHVSRHCGKGFQNHGSDVKVICLQMCDCYVINS